jgi:dimeric dUTPase (all-alpha-NTP-PPase superfamily)
MRIMNFFRSIFSRKHKEDQIEEPLKVAEESVVNEESNKIRELNTQIEGFVALSDYELEEEIDDIRTCLSYMEAQSIRIKKESNGYPNTAIDAGVWMDGYLLINYSEALAFFLSDKPYVKEEARSTKIWSDTVFSVCSHYHHFVGPAMIASASVAIKQGDLEYAKKAYSAVITDFLGVLESVEKEQKCPNKDDQISLDSLRLAVQGRLNSSDSDEEISTLISLEQRIKLIIDKPIEGNEST